MATGRRHPLWVALVVLAAQPALADAVGDPTGVWLDAEGRGAVEIATCGDGASMCGRVVWVKASEHQSRCGVQILGNLDRVRNGAWGGGWIYSPDYDRRFDVEVKRVGSDKLRVVGWAGVRMFSETHVWRRAPANLARCDGGEWVAGVPAREGGSAVVAAPQEDRAPPAATGSSRVAAADGTSSPLTATVPARPRARTTAAATPRPERRGEGARRHAKPARVTPNRVASGGGRAIETRYFKRTASGSCRVDTPWIKLAFSCRRL